MKNLNNMNTLNSYIRDEKMASREYRQFSTDPRLPEWMRSRLVEMSEDEARHMSNFIALKKILKEERKG